MPPPPPPAQLRAVVAPRPVCAAVSGRFSALAQDNCVATVEGGTLRLWGSPGAGKRAVERAHEPLPAPVLCQHAVRGRGGAELLFVLYAGMRWRLLQLDGARLRERAAGTLDAPEREPAETLFGRESVVCCALRRRGEPDCVLLAAWDRWLTVLPLDGEAPVTHLPLSGAAGLPTSAGLPPRVLRLVTWAGDVDATCNSAADPMGNPAVAVLYADDGLRLLSVQCVNLDLKNHAVLPGPWGLQNVGMVEAETFCDLVPLITPREVADVGSGVLVVGQDVVTYISGDGEQAAQIPFAELPGRPKPANHSALPRWQCCQVPSVGAGDTGLLALLIGGEAAHATTACLLQICVGSRAGRMHCGSAGADAVEIAASKVALPTADAGRRQRALVALVPGSGPGQMVGCAADGRVIDFRVDPKGRSVAKEMPMMAGWWNGGNSCAEVLATVYVPLTRRLPGVSSEGPRCAAAAAPTACETALAVCGVDDRSGTGDPEGGCVLLGRMGCARVATVPAATSFPELPSALHALLLPDGTSLLLCSFSGTTRGTQVLSMREDSSPPPSGQLKLQLDQAAPTLAVGGMGRDGIVQVTDEALHLIPARGHTSAASTVAPQCWAPFADGAHGAATIGAAAVCEMASLTAVGVGNEIVCCRCRSSSRDGADDPFEEVAPRFQCDGGQIAALGFYVPTGRDSDGRSAFLGYAEWGSNRVGVLHASTLQPAFDTGVVVLEAPSLCRSIAFFESGSGTSSGTTTTTTVWLLVGLADGQLLCYNGGPMNSSRGNEGSEGRMVLQHTLRVGSSPVELHCVEQGTEPSQPAFVYASSSRDLVISAAGAGAAGESGGGGGGGLSFADVTADERTLHIAPTAGLGGYGGMVWLSHPESGAASSSELSCGYIDVAQSLRWRRRDIEGHTPRLIEFHAQSQTLIVATEGPSAEKSNGSRASTPPAASPQQQQRRRRRRRQMLRVLNAETLEQLAVMELAAGHVVDQLTTDLPAGLLPDTLVTGAEVLMVSSLRGRRSDSSSSAEGGEADHPEVVGDGGDVQSLLSVLRVTTTREHEHARVSAKFSLVAQHNLGAGGSSVVTAMCPYCDRHGDSVLAVARGRGIEVLRLNPDAAGLLRDGMADTESEKANDKAKRKEISVGHGAMHVTLVAQVSLSGGGGLGCGLSAVGGYLMYTACSGPAGQSVLRWHEDLRLAPQLLTVASDRVEAEQQAAGGNGQQQRRAAATALLLPWNADDGTAGAKTNHANVEEEKEESETSEVQKFLAVVGPLEGGLRLFHHSASSELSLTPEAAAAAAAAAAAPVAALPQPPVALAQGLEPEPGPGPGPEPEPEPAAAMEPTADDLLAMQAEATAEEAGGDGSAAAAQSGAADDGETVVSRPCEMIPWLDQPAEGTSLRRVVGIHPLPAPAAAGASATSAKLCGLGVSPIPDSKQRKEQEKANQSGKVAPAASAAGGGGGGAVAGGLGGLLVVREDGTVQVMDLPE
jgi:hypothetical protein